jgi:hypothetical protein
MKDRLYRDVLSDRHFSRTRRITAADWHRRRMSALAISGLSGYGLKRSLA